jgi:hypothetical protein
MPDEPTLRVEYKNERPVELLDLTTSLAALGQSYEDFVTTAGFDPLPGNVRLYVREIRTGSIIAELKSMLDQASFVVEHKELFAAFLGNFNDLVTFFLLGKEAIPGWKPSRREAERTAQVFEPIAKDSASQLIMQVAGDVHVHQTYVYNSQQANAVQNKVRRFLGPSVPQVVTFQKEPLYLVQVRDDPKGQVGDRGVIEKFSDKPVKLQFMNETAKREVLESSENPFKLVFIVDGEVGYVGDRPAQYKINHVHEHFPRPDI